MNFGEALEILGITEYAERIAKSNSHGELIHLADYFVLAEHLKDNKEMRVCFSIWFKWIVKWSEENWQRPEAVFQHIQNLWINSCQQIYTIIQKKIFEELNKGETR